MALEKKTLLETMINNLNHSISIVIPHKNDSEIISKALASIATQLIKPDQVIIVDDDSLSEHKFRLAMQIKEFNSLPIELISSVGSGLAAARNTGIRYSRGILLAFLDCDDEWTPDKLISQVNAFTHNVVAVHGWCINVNNDKHETLLKPKVKYSQQSLINGDYSVTGSASCVMLKREIALKVGGFNENLKFAEDLDMWVRISKYGMFKCLEKPLVKIAIRSKSMQHNLRNDPKLKTTAHQIMIHDWIMQGLISKHVGKLILADRVLSISSEYSKVYSFTKVLAYLRNPFDSSNRFWRTNFAWYLVLALLSKFGLKK
jgi:glycosyltransferase involved in cell wall biosynthesis